MPENLPSLALSTLLSEQACYDAFIPLAGRITNLRTILQEPQAITKEEAVDWIADIDSTLNDFMTLLEHCRIHVKARITPPTMGVSI